MGFHFRRHSLKKADRTYDDSTTTSTSQVEARKQIAKNCSSRFLGLNKSINSHLGILEALAADLRRLDTEKAHLCAAEFSSAADALRGEFNRLQPIIKAESDRLNAFISECHTVEKSKTDWKKKKDGYDHARKNVHHMHDKPISDQHKLSKKEQKLMLKEGEFTQANQHLQTLASECTKSGDATIANAAEAIAIALAQTYVVIGESFSLTQAKVAEVENEQQPSDNNVVAAKTAAPLPPAPVVAEQKPNALVAIDQQFPLLPVSEAKPAAAQQQQPLEQRPLASPATMTAPKPAAPPQQPPLAAASEPVPPMPVGEDVQPQQQYVPMPTAEESSGAPTHFLQAPHTAVNMPPMTPVLTMADYQKEEQAGPAVAIKQPSALPPMEQQPQSRLAEGFAG